METLQTLLRNSSHGGPAHPVRIKTREIRKMRTGTLRLEALADTRIHPSGKEIAKIVRPRDAGALRRAMREIDE